MAMAHVKTFRTMKRTAERKGFALEATAKATATAMAIIIKNTIQ
jgi:cob(I)alamin adenosyltransferase